MFMILSNEKRIKMEIMLRSIIRIYICGTLLWLCDTKPTIEILPNSPVPYRLTVGDNLQLTCIYNNNDSNASNLAFYKDGALVSSRFLTIRQHSGDTVTLVIYTNKNNGVQMEDSGYYRCSYLDWYYQLYIQIIAISVTNDAEVYVGYNGHFVYYSTRKNLTLECSPAFPKSNISNQYTINWFRRGSSLGHETASKDLVSIVDNQLIIYRPDLDDIGEYMCMVSFENKDTLNKTVWIKAPPIIMKNYFNPQHLAVRHNLRIDCRAKGFPRPNIFWTKDHFLIQSNNRTQITTEVNDESTITSTLQITNASMTEQGLYRCNAESTAYQMGDDRCAQVYIYERDPPKIQSLKTKTSSDINEWKISCNASGFPFPDIYWFKDNKFLYQSDKFHITRFIPRFSILVINNVSADDQGVYGCFINTTQETDYRTVTLQYYEPYFLAHSGSSAHLVEIGLMLIFNFILCLSN